MRNPVKRLVRSDRLYRSVSPWEMASILATGEITGRGGTFSDDSRTKVSVWFSRDMEPVLHSGEDYLRYYQSLPEWEPAFSVLGQLRELERVAHVAGSRASTLQEHRAAHDLRSAAEKLDVQLGGAYRKAIYGLSKAAKEWIAKRKAPSSYVLEVEGAPGGVQYSGVESRQGGTTEVGFTRAEASRLHDYLTAIHLVKDGEVVDTLTIVDWESLVVVVPKPAGEQKRIASVVALARSLEPKVSALRAGLRSKAKRNPDERSRSRSRHAEGDEGRARVLADRLRRGIVTPQHLAVAGYLGDPAAAFVVPPWIHDWSSPVRHALQHAGLERELLVRLACDFAERVLPLFEVAHPGDRRPRAAIEAARAWVACPCEEHRKAAGAAYLGGHRAAYAAYAAAAARSAAYAADAAGNVAYAAAYANEVAYAAAAATHDAHSATASAYTTSATEREWQRQHMIAVLTGDAVATNPRRQQPDRFSPDYDEHADDPTSLRSAITPCGSRPKATDFHVVEGRTPATLILDVSNVRHYGPELFWENRCPLLAGFREGKKVITRKGVSFSGTPVYAKSYDLENLARRVGLPLERVERLLVLEGRAWIKSKGRKR